MKDLRIKVVEENLFIRIKRSDEKEVIIMIDSEDNVTINKHERKVASSENNVEEDDNKVFTMDDAMKYFG